MRRQLLIMVVLTFLSIGCGSGSDFSSSFPTDTGPPTARQVERTGMVFLDRVAAGVKVEVLPLRGDSVLFSTTTSPAGIFHLPASLVLPFSKI